MPWIAADGCCRRTAGLSSNTNPTNITEEDLWLLRKAIINRCHDLVPTFDLEIEFGFWEMRRHDVRSMLTGYRGCFCVVLAYSMFDVHFILHAVYVNSPAG